MDSVFGELGSSQERRVSDPESRVAQREGEGDLPIIPRFAYDVLDLFFGEGQLRAGFTCAPSTVLPGSS